MKNLLFAEIKPANISGNAFQVVCCVHFVHVIAAVVKFLHGKLREDHVHRVLGVALVFAVGNEFLHLFHPSRRVRGAQFVEGLERKTVGVENLYRNFLNTAVRNPRLEVLFGKLLASVDAAKGGKRGIQHRLDQRLVEYKIAVHEQQIAGDVFPC